MLMRPTEKVGSISLTWFLRVQLSLVFLCSPI